MRTFHNTAILSSLKNFATELKALAPHSPIVYTKKTPMQNHFGCIDTQDIENYINLDISSIDDPLKNILERGRKLNIFLRKVLV